MIKRMALTELDQVVDLYIKYIPDSFFRCLGRDFVWQLLRSAALSRNTVCYVYWEKSRASGFIVALIDKRAFFQEFLTKQGKFLMYCILRTLFADMRMTVQMLETAFYAMKRDRASEPGAELVFSAVQDDCRRKGVCSALIAEVFSSLRKKGIGQASVSVLSHNAAARNLLEKAGFFKRREFQLYGKQMISYTMGVR